MKLYDLSQPLNQDCFFWPYYPPFEVKYIKRKVEHGVNAQYIRTSNHMGTHLDAPRHFHQDAQPMNEYPLENCIVRASASICNTSLPGRKSARTTLMRR